VAKRLGVSVRRDACLPHKATKKNRSGERRVSEMGRRLRRLREQMVAEGVPHLSLEEIRREVAERRGGYYTESE